ncbi:hypothetical protein [Aurantiacibacter sp. D1-12]|uniref:hypothetical protein n=1 Tax=Aurantiacibacter sp. D1-12 TaxID=2993658 RepID=UPI00237CD6A3|nr:hypothetical protein [Aurantiacibacter sp. D1-12]MDE1468019.1 hypothetical protein [Aurantiacibacter sp. D1-12]
MVEPLSEVAPTQEILDGVSACRAALSDGPRLNDATLEHLGWTSGTHVDDRGRQRKLFSKQNLLIEIQSLAVLDNCIVNGQIANEAQLDELRAGVAGQLSAEQVSEGNTPPGLLNAIRSQYGENAPDSVLDNHFIAEDFVYDIATYTRPDGLYAYVITTSLAHSPNP